MIDADADGDDDSDTRRVFISYRRDDGALAATLIHSHLLRRLPQATVFLDVEAIEHGERFPDRIAAALDGADTLVAVIGPRWIEARDAAGRRRLDDPDDFVVREITRAFERGLHVQPVLVDGASPPSGRKIPASIAALADLNAITLDPRNTARGLSDVVASVRFRGRISFEEAWRGERRRRRRRAAMRVGIVAATLTAILMLLASVLDLLHLDTSVERYTLRAAAALAPSVPSPQVTIVGVAESTVLRDGRVDPHWRADLAAVIDRLSARSPRAIVLDLTFGDDEPASDASLAAAIERAGSASPPVPVIVAAATLDGGAPPLPDALRSLGPAWGVSCLGRRDATVVGYPLAICPAGKATDEGRCRTILPSLAMAALAGGAAPAAASDSPASFVIAHPLVDDPELRFPRAAYVIDRATASSGCGSIGDGATIAMRYLQPADPASWREALVPFEAIAAGQPLPADRFTRRFVLIGRPDDPADRWPVSAPGGSQRAGLLLQADALSELLSPRPIRRLGFIAQAVLVALSALAGGLVSFARPRAAIAGLLVLYALVAVLACAFGRVVWNPLYPAAAAALAWWALRRMHAEEK